jgi:hypothetical protein
MGIDRLTAAVVGLLVVAATVDDVQGQVRSLPRPLRRASDNESRSLFGDRSLGFPVYPKPSDFGGGGQFGPRPNFRRGFTAEPSFSLLDNPSPGSEYGGQADFQLDRGATETGPVVDRWQVPVEQAAQLGQPPGPANMPWDQSGGQTGPLAGQAAQNVGRAGQTGPPREGIGGGSGPHLTPGMTGVPGGAGQGGTPSSPPRFQWRTDFLRGQRPEFVLVERLRKALGDRLSSPLDVTIDGQTAVLRGTVATDHDRRLAELVARFEPGVLQVKNELEVAGAASSRPVEGR